MGKYVSGLLLIKKGGGDDGLKRARQRTVFSFQKKLSVVKSYLTSELSYQELAFQSGIGNPSIIARWVSKFRVVGSDALRPHKKGRKKTMGNSKENKPVENIQDYVLDTSPEHVRELEDELLKLRIENAFLKELRRLRLEDEARMRDAHGPSTVSEDNSN